MYFVRFVQWTLVSAYERLMRSDRNIPTKKSNHIVNTIQIQNIFYLRITETFMIRSEDIPASFLNILFMISTERFVLYFFSEAGILTYFSIYWPIVKFLVQGNVFVFLAVISYTLQLSIVLVFTINSGTSQIIM